jgi:hypothetical protein
MKTKAYLQVVPASEGRWAVHSTVGRQSTTVYASKEEAVTAARNVAQAESRVIVKTSAGQILRPPSVKTSRDIASMRAAVLQSLKKKKDRAPVHDEDSCSDKETGQ